MRKCFVAGILYREASFRDNIDNWPYGVNTGFVKYTDADMKMMAIGEIGAHFMAILLAVAAWMYLGDTSAFLKAPVALAALMVGWKLSLAIVHFGYKPEDSEG